MRLLLAGAAVCSWVAIGTLLSAPAAHAAQVTLIWTSPGDDGYTGVAAAYDIRYSTTPIDDSNFGRAAGLAPAA